MTTDSGDMLAGFTISEDHAEVYHDQCRGWTHIGSLTFADALRLISTHAGSCEPGTRAPQFFPPSASRFPKVPADVACPVCGGYVRGHQWIGMGVCSVVAVFPEG